MLAMCIYVVPMMWQFVFLLMLPFTADFSHFVYVNQDSTDAHGVILHSSREAMQDIDHMKFLYKLGYEKAVILGIDTDSFGMGIVTFQESIGHLQERPRKPRPLAEWPPPRQPRVACTKIFDTKRVDQSHPDCLLRLGVTLHELARFFDSAGDLCTSFEGIDVPEASMPFLKALQPPCGYDRIIIYVDGSSQALQKHCAPLWVDLHGVPDSWAFVAIGETYDAPPDERFCLLGWQAQQVRYQEDSNAFAGALRIGSLIAEREGLFLRPYGE